MIGRALLAVVLAALLIWRLILAEIEERREAAGRRWQKKWRQKAPVVNSKTQK